MKYALCATLLVMLAYTSLNAAGIKGIVAETRTGEPIVGAVVILSGSQQYHAAVGLDGSYAITGIAEGTYQLKTAYLGYMPFSKEIHVKANDELVVNLELQPDNGGIKEVEIVGHFNGNNDIGARQLEKKSESVINVLSQSTIELMPDVTVANVLRRVSGVTVDRGDNGDGRYPVIRGMDKRYNYTLVNGVKIPSPDDKNRFVPMDVFPSEMLERLEVIKSLTPDMEGDAIGGVMNLVMKDAPDKLQVDAQAAIGYSQMLFDEKFTTYDYGAVSLKSPAEIYGGNYDATFNDFTKANLDFKKVSPLPDNQLSFTIGDRFLSDKLGVLFSGSYQSYDRISHETFMNPNPQPNPTSTGNTASFDDIEIRDYSTHQQRVGLNAKIDYRINPTSKISFYTVYMNLNTYQTRYTIDTSLSGRPGPGFGEVGLDYRSKTTLQDIYNSTLQGEHTLLNDHFTIDWSAVYSYADQRTPDEAELQLSEVASVDSGQHKVTSPLLSALPRFWQHNSDQDVSGYLNLHYKFDLADEKFDIGAGGMYRHKERDNYFNQYDQLQAPPNTPFTNIYNAQFYFPNPADGQGTQNSDPNIYTTTENISAAYLELKWQPITRWNVLAGIRAENTYQDYDQTADPNTVAAKSGYVSYTDILPSFDIKYSLTDDAALRLSYFKSISRPEYFEIVPYFFPGEYFNEVGNPNLVPAVANNVDLRYELIPRSTDELLVGVFYKNIQGPIEYVYIRNVVSQTELQPQNLGTATNFGAEIVYTKYFNRFGVSANYTYTNSNVPTVEKLYYYNGHADTIKYLTVNLPLQGQAAHIGNLSLLYKDPERRFDIQVSGVYTGNHIVFLSPFAGLDYYQKGTIVLDFSAEKSIGKHFSIYCKLTNLLNTPDIWYLNQGNPYYANHSLPYQTSANQITVDVKYFGQTYLLGVRYHL